MKHFLDSISLSSGAHIARSMLVGATAAFLLIGCASAPQPQETRNDSLSRTAQLRPQADTIGQMHEAKKAALRGCFEAGQSEGVEPGQSRVEVELRLRATGVPTKVRVVNKDELNPAVARCLEEVVGGFNYGKSERGATFYQVFIFDGESNDVAFEKPMNAYQRWGLTRKEIREVFLANEDALNLCYELAADKPEGRVVLSMAIRMAGPPERVGLKSSTLENEKVDMCLVEAVLAMEFPAPRGDGITVREVPLHFNADEGWMKPKRKPIKHVH